MTKNNYQIEKIIESLFNKGHTNFIIEEDLIKIKGKLSKNSYQIYKPYEDASKVILFKKTNPKLVLFKIICKVPIRHQDVLGTIFSLGLKEDTFGDIINYENSFYFYTLPNLEEYFKSNMLRIKDNPIILENISLSFSTNFKQNYLIQEYIVTSCRIDNIISTIIGDSRKNILTLFKDKAILLNYEEVQKPTKILKENDIFSIRRYGKYQYNGIKRITKKGSYVIEIKKYI